MSEQTNPTSETPPSKTEVVRQIAHVLAERRAARSLTLEKVSQAIKIRVPYLQAMEKGDWDQLPAEVYVRGFVRRYAQYLGLDGDKLIEPYVKLATSSLVPSLGASPTRRADFGRIQWVWFVLAGVFLIGFIKVVNQERAAPIKSTSPAKPAPVAPSNKLEEAKAEQKPILEKHQMDLFSPFPLWLRVTASDKSFEGFIPQGSTWTWKGEGAFAVRLGHTKEVRLFFDGKEVSLAEDQKKVILPL